MNEEKKPTVAECEAALRDAMKQHETAKQGADVASSIPTRATNELNAAQKAFDEAVERTRKAAPWNTDWSSRRDPRRSAYVYEPPPAVEP